MRNFMGTCACPDCDQAGAQVGIDKSGNPYSFCDSADCEGTQWWTRGKKARVSKLLGRLLKGKPVDAAQVHELAAKFGLKLDGPAPTAPTKTPAPAAAPARESAPAKEQRSGFTLLGRKS